MRLLLLILLMAVQVGAPDYAEIVRRCGVETGYFQDEVLGQKPTAGQKQILRSVRKHRRTLVRSGHGTGKSNVLGGLILEFLSVPHVFCPGLKDNATVRVVATASSNPQIQDVLWKEVGRQWTNAAFPLGGRMLEREWKVTPERNAIALSVREPTALQGKHAELVLVVVDEAEGIPLDRWQALESLTTGENAFLVAVYNPVRSGGYMAEQARRPDLWNQIHLSGLDHPNVIEGHEVIPGAITRTWIMDQLQKECRVDPSTPWDEVDARLRAGEFDDNAVICARVLGKHPKGSAFQIITIDDLERVAAGVELARPEPRSAGLDVAYGGLDQTVLTVLDENRNVIDSVACRLDDTQRIASWAWEHCQAHGVLPQDLHVEADGIGGGVADALRKGGVRCDRVVMGGEPKQDWRSVTGGLVFRNRRAQLWWVGRLLLRAEATSVGRQYGEIWADLVAPDYDHDAQNRIVVEAKDKLREKFGRSTDHGDSFIIALSRSSMHRREREQMSRFAR